jgi:endonuclease/exonuclease/phosphatase (EEP) superfamily protein YafD
LQRSILWAALIGSLAFLAIHYLSGHSPLGIILGEVWPLYVALGVGLALSLVVFNAPGRIGWAATLASLVTSAVLMAEADLGKLGVFKIPVTNPSGHGEIIKVASFNVWASNQNLDATVDFIVERQFDLISAQEVGLNSRALPERLQDIYPYQFTCGRGVYIFSRRAFLETGCPDTPPNMGRRMPIAWADIAWNEDERLRFVAVHLARPMEMNWRRPQIDRLEAFVASHNKQDMILAGDFNAGHSGRSMRELEDRFAPMRRADDRSPTWPSSRLGGIPVLALDQIWISEDVCLLTNARGPALGSDHRPVSGLIARCRPIEPAQQAP